MIDKPFINKNWIDPQARTLVRRLQDRGHETYLVGGCVRDLLVGLPPKDWDIATSARPRQVVRILRPSYMIGRRFKLVLVPFHQKTYEVSTFRAPTSQTFPGGGPIRDDNTFGTVQQDAHRRDFTVNSFFYDPIKNSLKDYTGGGEDLKNGVVRMIGNPRVRIEEDPLRMLRALRFSHKISFQIESHLRSVMEEMASQLELCVLPRRREEILKFLRLPRAQGLFWECLDLGLLKFLFPCLDSVLRNGNPDEFHRTLALSLYWISHTPFSHELFACLLFALLCGRDSSFLSHLTVDENFKELLIQAMKKELGMYQLEQDFFFETLSTMKKLGFSSRGRPLDSKRFQDLLAKDSGPLAVTLCHVFHLGLEPHFYKWMEVS